MCEAAPGLQFSGNLYPVRETPHQGTGRRDRTYVGFTNEYHDIILSVLLWRSFYKYMV
jgi:hypothetical protein